MLLKTLFWKVITTMLMYFHSHLELLKTLFWKVITTNPIKTAFFPLLLKTLFWKVITTRICWGVPSLKLLKTLFWKVITTELITEKTIQSCWRPYFERLLQLFRGLFGGRNCCWRPYFERLLQPLVIFALLKSVVEDLILKGYYNISLSV